MPRRILPIILALAAVICISVDAGAAKPRTSGAVRQEQKQNRKKMEQTRTRLNDNSAEVRRQLAALERIEGDIKAGDERIRDLGLRTDSLGRSAKTMADSVALTQQRVETLKKSYASALRAIRSQRQLSSATAFIFSSKSFTEARKRIRYLRELGEWQKEKARELKTSTARLNAQKERLDSARTRLATAMGTLRKERRDLESRHNRADALVAKLKKQGRKLESALSEQKKRAKKLDDELNRIIEQEARAAAEAERKRKAREAEEKRRREQAAREKAAKEAATSGTPAEKPVEQTKPASAKPAPKGSDKAAAASFEDAKGKLPMPVSGSAVIVSEFGRHAHKDLKRVEVQNNGIDIETTPGSYATAVFPGTVTMVIVMDGYHNVVLVRHGEYLTVYAGLSSLQVRKGQEVKAGQALGTIWSDPDDGRRTRLHFEVRHEKDKLDPAEWLR